MRNPSLVRVTGPLEPFSVGFAAALRVDGYTARGVTAQLQLMAHLRSMARRGVSGRGALDWRGSRASRGRSPWRWVCPVSFASGV